MADAMKPIDAAVRAGCEALHPTPELQAKFPCVVDLGHCGTVIGGCDIPQIARAVRDVILAETPEVIEIMAAASMFPLAGRVEQLLLFRGLPQDTREGVMQSQMSSLAALRQHFGD